MEIVSGFFGVVYAAVLTLYKGNEGAVVGACFGYLLGLFLTSRVSDDMPSLSRDLRRTSVFMQFIDIFALWAVTLAFVPILYYRFPGWIAMLLNGNGASGRDVVVRKSMEFDDAAIVAVCLVLFVGISVVVDNFSIIIKRLIATINELNAAITNLKSKF